MALAPMLARGRALGRGRKRGTPRRWPRHGLCHQHHEGEKVNRWRSFRGVGVQERRGRRGQVTTVSHNVSLLAMHAYLEKP